MEGYPWERRRRRVQCSDASSGVRGMDVGPPRSGRARLSAIRYRGGSGVAAVLLAQLTTYDGRWSSAPVTSSRVERRVVTFTIHRVRYAAQTWPECFRPPFHGAPCVRLIFITSDCGQTSQFSLSVKTPLIVPSQNEPPSSVL